MELKWVLLIHLKFNSHFVMEGCQAVPLYPVLSLVIMPREHQSIVFRLFDIYAYKSNDLLLKIKGCLFIAEIEIDRYIATIVNIHTTRAGIVFLCAKLDNDKIFFILCTTKESTQRNLRDNRYIFIKIFVDRCTATDIIYTRVGNLIFFLPVFLYHHFI